MPKGIKREESAAESTFLRALQELKSHYREFSCESQVWARLGHRRSPYRVMVLFGLSARTKDKLLVETCHRFFLNFPDPSSLLAQWPAQRTLVESIVRKGQLPFVESLAAKLGEWGGVVPQDKAKLLRVAGVGEKISECVLAYGWGEESLPMDGHGCRLHQRLLGLPDVAKSWKAANIRDCVKTIFHRRREWMKSLNIALVDIHELLRLHSQVVCGRSPDCQRCPVSQCHSRRREYLDCEPTNDINSLWQDWRDLILEPEPSR